MPNGNEGNDESPRVQAASGGHHQGCHGCSQRRQGNRSIEHQWGWQPKFEGRDDTIPTRNGQELGEIWVSKVGTTKIDQTGRESLSCAYTTQLLHSTVEVCWNNNDSYFIWFKLCAETPDR